MTTSNLYSGMLWLRRPADKPDAALTEAVEYAERKYGRPVRLVMRPEGEEYPSVWRDAETGRDVPVQGDRRVLPSHLYLVTAVAQGAADEDGWRAT